MTFTGDAIDDLTLLQCSHNADLFSLTINGAPRVTDIGIGGAVLNSPELRQLSIAGTNARATYGHFIPKVLELRHLQHLELKSTMLDLQDEDAGRVQSRCARAHTAFAASRLLRAHAAGSPAAPARAHACLCHTYALPFQRSLEAFVGSSYS